jgi:prepilin-type N-terminal cleavage/methylation domain-containing protein
MKKGFTLVELMVSLAIFAFMTAFLLAKYGNFNQSTLLTNLAYDTALTIRSAQSYGLNVQGTTNNSCTGVYYTPGTVGFCYPYGVDFNRAYPTSFVLFTDLNSNGQYATSTGEVVSTYNMNRGFSIQGICVGASASSCTQLGSSDQVDVTFKRPIPDAIIKAKISGTWQSNSAYAQITLTANNSTTTVVVQSTGEVSVGN